MKALSIRAPWWWFILHGGKDIENRDWHTNFRGSVLIHAAKGLVLRDLNDDYKMAASLSSAIAFNVAAISQFRDEKWRGAIVGKVDIVGCTTYSASPWFFGRYGFQLENPVAFQFPIPFKGSLGFFDVPDDLVQNAVPMTA